MLLKFPAFFQDIFQVYADFGYLFFFQVEDIPQGFADGWDVLFDVASLLEFLLYAHGFADMFSKLSAAFLQGKFQFLDNLWIRSDGLF